MDELVQLLLNCYNSKERSSKFSLFEVCKTSSCKYFIRQISSSAPDED